MGVLATPAASISPFDAMLARGMVSMPLRTSFAAVTLVSGSSHASQGALKPVSRLSISAAGLDAEKALSIVCLSRELLRFSPSQATALLSRELRTAVAAATNSRLIEILTTGISPSPSTGDPLADLAAMLASVNLTSTSAPYLLVGPTTASQLATRSTTSGQPAFPAATPMGGNVQGVPILVSDQLVADSSGERIILADAAGLCGGSEAVLLDFSETATLQLDEAPIDNATAVHTSLFQSGLHALKAERYFGARRIRDSAVAIIDGADYSQVVT